MALAAVAALLLDEMTRGKWGLVAAVTAGVMALWALTTHYPRAGKGSVVVLVAIRCEDDAHYRRLRADFVDQLRELLHADPGEHQLQLVELSPAQAADLLDARAVERAAKKARCLFALYGLARQRKVRGEEIHILDLRGMVRHGAIPSAVAKNLAREFASVMPGQIQVGKDDAVPAFQLTSEWLDGAARYVLGLAALASNHLTYAERLLLDVRERVCTLRTRNAGIGLIAARVNRPLAALYEARAREALARHRTSKAPSDLREMQACARQTLKYDASNYSAHLGLAFCAYELDGDVRGLGRG